MISGLPLTHYFFNVHSQPCSKQLANKPSHDAKIMTSTTFINFPLIQLRVGPSNCSSEWCAVGIIVAIIFVTQLEETSWRLSCTMSPSPKPNGRQHQRTGDFRATFIALVKHMHLENQVFRVKMDFMRDHQRRFHGLWSFHHVFGHLMS